MMFFVSLYKLFIHSMGALIPRPLRRASDYLDAGQFDQAEALIREALRSLPLESETAGRALEMLGEVLFAKGGYAEAEHALRSAVSIFARTGWTVAAAEAHRFLAWIADRNGRSYEGIRLLRFAIAEQARRGGVASADLHRTLGLVLLNAGWMEESLSVSLEAAERYRVLGDLRRMMQCRITAAGGYVALGRREEAMALLDDLFPIVSSLPAIYRTTLFADAVTVAVNSGAKRKALRWANEGLKAARHQESEVMLASALYSAGWADDEFGDPVRAVRLYSEALQLAERLGLRSLALYVHLSRAEGCARRDDRGGMKADLEAIEGEGAWVAESVDGAPYFTLQARYWMSVDAEKALSFSARAVEIARGRKTLLFLGPALHRNGEILIHLGRTSEAAAPLQEALETFQNLNRPEETDAVKELLRGIGATAIPRVPKGDATAGSEFTAKSLVMRDLLAQVALIAASKAPVVLEGESGAGKETLAREIHRLSGRTGLFVVMQGGAMSENLIEDELFGHSKGAFTGALTDRRGKFELADGGTLFIDYVSEISLAVQAKLLRVIQFGEIVRLGSEEARKVDVRVITASQKPLRQLVNEGRLRDDLYYRLSVMMLSVPPMRERQEDVPLLFRSFLRQIAVEFRRGMPRVGEGVDEALAGYSFPGNLRELENIAQRAFILCEDGEIRREHLPPYVLEGTPPPVVSADSRGDVSAQSLRKASTVAMAAARASVERTYLQRLLARAGGNLSEGARLAGLTRMQLHLMMRRSGDPRVRRPVKGRP